MERGFPSAQHVGAGGSLSASAARTDFSLLLNLAISIEERFPEIHRLRSMKNDIEPKKGKL